jgi:protein O-GlcNAc transferase
MSVLVSLLKDIFARKRARAKPASPDRPAAPQPQSPPLPEFGQSEQQKLEGGIAYFSKVLESDPNRVEALFSLGMLHDIANREDDAMACYRRILTINPSHYGAMMALVHLEQNRCDWAHLESRAADLRTAVRSASAVDQTTFIAPFSFLSLPGTTAAEQRRCSERYARMEFHHPEIEAARSRLAFSFKGRKNDRIRIGYLSSDFFSHATARLMARVFELHDRSRFHITAYSYGADDTSLMRKRLEQAFDHFVDIQDATHEDAAKKIFADGIDILVDLKGYTQHSRTGILALRPAPIQVNYLGYPGTMGTDLVDYILADGFVIPPEQRKYFAEKVICLPDCYQPSDNTRPHPPAPLRSECGLPEQGFVFCCFNQTYKITPEVFAVWCRLLQAVPGSCLWLWANHPHAEANLRAAAARNGVSPDRLIMAPSIWDAEKHLARLQCADLFLDTLPYNAHTTCSDALWMGLPVVTCAGETFPSRVAGSLLTALGVPELIAESLDDYYRLALELATDREKLAGVRDKIIAGRGTAALFDSARFTANLEQAYVQMLAAHSGTDVPGAAAMARR